MLNICIYQKKFKKRDQGVWIKQMFNVFCEIKKGMKYSRGQLEIIIIIIIIKPRQFIKRCKWWFGPHPIKGTLTLLMTMDRECSRVDPNCRGLHYVCMYRLQPTTPHHPGIITPTLLVSINLPTPKGWIAWWARADCMHITFAQGYYTIEFKGTGRKWIQIVWPKNNSIPMNQPRRT